MEENYENVTLIDDLLRDNASTFDARTACNSMQKKSVCGCAVDFTVVKNRVMAQICVSII